MRKYEGQCSADVEVPMSDPVRPVSGQVEPNRRPGTVWALLILTLIYCIFSTVRAIKDALTAWPQMTDNGEDLTMVAVVIDLVIIGLCVLLLLGALRHHANDPDPDAGCRDHDDRMGAAVRLQLRGLAAGISPWSLGDQTGPAWNRDRHRSADAGSTHGALVCSQVPAAQDIGVRGWMRALAMPEKGMVQPVPLRQL